MTNPVTKIREFCAEVAAELKKSSWPTRKELVDSTIVVMITIGIMGVFVAMADFIFLKIVGLLTGSV
jgi:preprotein translocase subunit SecE